MRIDGRAIAKQICDEIAYAIATTGKRAPRLTAILVGENPASIAYLSRKTQQSRQVGIQSDVIRLPTDITEAEMLTRLEECNRDPEIDGILVQLPLPAQISSRKVVMAVDPEKDVDGFNPINLGKLLIGEATGFIPCTPLGIVKLLAKSQVEVSGKHVVIVGRSSIVGKPLAALLLQKAPGCNATVTVAHSATRDLEEHCQRADILVAALGSPHFITAPMVKEGAVVIDVGVNRIEDANDPKGFRLVGDVVFDSVEKKASLITPVPGGVGPMTVAMLMHNTFLSYQRRLGLTL